MFSVRITYFLLLVILKNNYENVRMKYVYVLELLRVKLLVTSRWFNRSHIYRVKGVRSLALINSLQSFIVGSGRNAK